MYYDSIEEAIKAAPDCTHVLTTGSEWDMCESTKGKYAPVYKINGAYCRHRYSSKVTFNTGVSRWVVAHDRIEDNISRPEPITAAQFDQAATERQVGGDHYKSLKIQPIEYIDANNLPYLEGNVIKYVTRHASKNGVQDIDKAIHYLELIKQMRYSTQETN